MARLVVVLLVVVVAACSGGGEREIGQARSWSATAMLIAESWLRDEVPSPYARDGLEKAARELAGGAYPEAAQPVADLEGAVARGDRREVRRLLDELRR